MIKPLRPARLRAYIQALGASFIKLAQVLATRADFFTEEYLDELRGVHDDIPKMSHEDFRKVYEKAFGERDPFKTFLENPIASASIGQVHHAVLMDGTEAAVKLRRYDIEKIIRADIKILRFFNRIFKPLFSEYTKNSIEGVIEEFTNMITREVDLYVELQNMKKFAETYPNSGIRYPEPYDKYCSSDALVMSFEHGFRFDDRRVLERLNVSFEEVMEKLIYFYTDQMLVNGFFHADPHPGNLMITPDGELILLDFGMVKRISERTRKSIIEIIKAANERDFETYIKACKKLGIIGVDAPDNLLQEVAERMFDIFSNETLDAKSMQTLAFEVLNSVKNLPFKLPQEAIYIMRVSSIIEGLGTNYIDNFNGIKDILPVLKENMPRALGIDDKFIEFLKGEAIEVPFTLRKMKKIINDVSDNSLEIKISKESIDYIREKSRSYYRPIVNGAMLVVVGFFVVFLGFDKSEYVGSAFFFVGMLRVFFAI
ncbi:ABC1 kinase family protein [Limisalsivibrio acetivorans]|uniref:ABC1 kinase family protein n=1 Tax=Limisalsivibrio acetivorans TaxID=1304888 RepID=UPI001EE1EF29|nr:AarF/UbiB family protein [Limisalsivibrio acetivorans]